MKEGMASDWDNLKKAEEGHCTSTGVGSRSKEWLGLAASRSSSLGGVVTRRALAYIPEVINLRGYRGR